MPDLPEYMRRIVREMDVQFETVKIEAGHYKFRRHGVTIGDATLTGRPGVDDYPWSVGITFDTGPGTRTTYTAATLAEAKDWIRSRIREAQTRGRGPA